MDAANYSTEVGDDSAPQWVYIPLRVGTAQDGHRLDRFVSSRVGRLSRTRVQSIIESGNVLRDADGEELRRPSLRVRAGELLYLRRPAPTEPAVVRDYRPVFEDEDLFVIDKAAGLPVHPTARYHRNTLTALMRERLGDDHPWVMAHRLDRETSGVMVFGRRGHSSAAIKTAFARRRIHKRYLALCHGRLTAAARIDFPIGLGTSAIRIKMGAKPVVEGGLPAVTDVEPLRHGELRGDPVTLVSARPHTGRQHQIRVHLSLHGHPVVGDKMYGLDERHFIDMVEGRTTMAELDARVGLPRHALHAEAITLPHPRHGDEVSFTAPWPTDLAAVLSAP